MFKVVIKYDKGQETADTLEFLDFGTAATYALNRADELSLSASEGPQRPTQVRIQRGDRLELAISLDVWGLFKR